MNQRKYTKAFPVVEVVLVLAAFPILSKLAQAIGFRHWELEHLGFRYISDTMVYFLIPVAVLILSGKSISDYGFRTSDLAYHSKIGLKGTAVLFLVSLVFPIMALLGTTYYEWLGSIVLTVAHIVGIGALLFWLRRDPSGPISSVDRMELPRFVAFIVISFTVGWAVLPPSKTVAKALYWFVFVGYLQEALFRGYVQSRLNDVFGRPFSIVGVCFGPGLIITSLLFGHFHLLNAGAQYPWVICTTAAGLFFGVIREKTGSIIASGFAHGLWLIPAAIFEGS